MSELISVLMNCYNGERYLKEAIDSVYAQSYQNWEIIFIDNCSTDNSANIAKGYCERLRYYKTAKNISLGEARNMATDFCGKYIATLDADDVWEPHALESLYKGINSGDFALCYGNQIVVNAEGKTILKKKCKYAGFSGDFLEKLLFQFDIPMVATIINKDKMVASKLNFNPDIIGSVEYSLFLPLSIDHSFISIDSYVVKYRCHNSLSSTLDKIRHLERRKILDQMLIRNPEIKNRASKGLIEAYARADYYEAQGLMKEGARIRSFLLLIKNSKVDLRYLTLALVSILPRPVWRFLQKIKYKN